MDRDSFDTMVIVKVGPLKTEFKVHKGLLCNVAPYFKAALEGDFFEGQDQVLELPEDDVLTFQRFQLWLYSNNILEEDEAVQDVWWELLADLYYFGEMRGIPALQNTVIDTMIDKQYLAKVEILPVRIVRKVYKLAPNNDALRRLLVDWTACLVDLEVWVKNGFLHKFPPAFLVDLALAQYQLRQETKKSIHDFRDVRSSYHVNIPAENTTP